MDWFQLVCDTFKVLPGYVWGATGEAVYEGSLLNYAAFQGSVEILRWLVEEKGWELNRDTEWYAGAGGGVEVLAYLWKTGNLGIWGYKFTRDVCAGAAWGGHLEALKWARSQDPPCPWDERTCACAAGKGHLEVLKFLRGQEPPCPWTARTCTCAAEKGRLDVLKWVRAQHPPCPWDEGTCREAARGGHLDVLKWLQAEEPPCPWSRRVCRERAFGHVYRERALHQHVIDWIDQEEDESDVSSYDSYSSHDSDSYSD